MAQFVRHKLVTQVGQTSHTFWFLSPPNLYNAPLTAAITGVTQVPDNDETIDSYGPLCTVEALLRSGLAVRKIISYKVGTKRRYAKIIVAKNLADTFVAPATFKGDPAPKVVNPLDASFS